MGAPAPGLTSEIGARPAAEGLVVLTVPAPVVSPSRLVCLADGPIVAWSSHEAEPDGRVWSILGWGEAARLEAGGEGRLAEIRARSARLFDGIREQRCALRGERVEAEPAIGGGRGQDLSLRLFGGVSFRPEIERDGANRSIERDARGSTPPWGAFRDASFTMPRWLYGSHEGGALLRLTVARGEEGQALRQLAAMLARIEGERARSRAESAAPLSRSEVIAGGRPDPSTTPETWRAMVLDALDRIRARDLEKVVAAAVRRVLLADPIEIASLLRRMEAAYPSSARFVVQRGGVTFAGASPERLVTVRGLRVEADGLAGSSRRAPLDADDAAAASALLASDKDRREHALVVSAIASILRARCRTLRVPEAPVVRTLRNVHHLWTPIAGDLSRPTHVLELVDLIHPTPAVCGWPKEAAMAWIASREAAPRGWYAGAVGWFDEAGNGSFAVAIRSGLIDGQTAWIYAGAGLVEGSDPDAELAETRLKQAPILAALGLSS